MEALVDSKLFTGALIIAMNLSTRHVVSELTPMQDKLMASLIARRIALFAMFYVAIRDVMASLTLTFFFSVFFCTLLNEKSPYCILNKNLV